MKEEEISSEETEYETGTYPKTLFDSGPCKNKDYDKGSRETSPMTTMPLR